MDVIELLIYIYLNTSKVFLQNFDGASTYKSEKPYFSTLGDPYKA